jgi:hypothetical protein
MVEIRKPSMKSREQPRVDSADADPRATLHLVDEVSVTRGDCHVQRRGEQFDRGERVRLNLNRRRLDSWSVALA